MVEKETLTKGKVIGSTGGLYRVYQSSGERVFCKPRGKFRHEKLRVLVGDNVGLYEDEGGNLCIDEVLLRKNELLRPRISNIDKLFVVAAASSPAPVYLNIDKLTAICEQNRIEPLIVITKSDLSSESAEKLRSVYSKTGYRVLTASGFSGQGLEELRAYIGAECRGQTIGFAGASGVGKSTLLNGLFPSLSLETQSVSRKIERGRHTTRSVELFPLCELTGGKVDGFIADTPGFSLLDFENFDFFSLEDLPENFPEFRPYLGKCRYTKCTHRKEEGCAILEKMREGSIAAERVNSYTELYAQLKDKRFS